MACVEIYFDRKKNQFTLASFAPAKDFAPGAALFSGDLETLDAESFFQNAKEKLLENIESFSSRVPAGAGSSKLLKPFQKYPVLAVSTKRNETLEFVLMKRDRGGGFIDDPDTRKVVRKDAFNEEFVEVIKASLEI